MSARLSSLFSRTTACANGRMIFVPCLYAPVRVGTFMCSTVCVVMRCEKRVRTKKRVATSRPFGQRPTRLSQGEGVDMRASIGNQRLNKKHRAWRKASQSHRFKDIKTYHHRQNCEAHQKKRTQSNKQPSLRVKLLHKRCRLIHCGLDVLRKLQIALHATTRYEAMRLVEMTPSNMRFGRLPKPRRF